MGQLYGSGDCPASLHKRLVLVMSHRHANFGDSFRNICRARRSVTEKSGAVPLSSASKYQRQDCGSKISGRTIKFIRCKPIEYAPSINSMKRA